MTNEYCRGLKEAVLSGNVEMEEDTFSYCGDVVISKTEAGEDGTQDQSDLVGVIEDILTGSMGAEEGAFELAIDGSPAEQNGVIVTLIFRAFHHSYLSAGKSV